MDTFFYNNYYEYFLWNTGLIEHFFLNNQSSEILLYVDEQLIEEIGKSKGIIASDYKKEFISSVEHFCAHYNRYICKHYPNGNNVCRYSDCRYNSSFFCLKNSRRSDVLAVANHIYSKDIRYFDRYENSNGEIKIRISKDKEILEHKMPFFAIVIYVILKFDNGKTQEWNNVGQEISPDSRTFIPEIWEKINLFDSRFDKDASVYNRDNPAYGDYAGRILYHLPLSASIRNKIQDAIFKSSVWKLVDSKSFFDIIGLILNSLKDIKANEELKNILLNCYSSEDYNGISVRKIQAVIDDFDIDAYESKMSERKVSDDYEQTVISGEFALGIYLPNNDGQVENSIVLLTTVQQYVHDGGFCIKEGNSGTLAGYNTSFVDRSGKIELKDYVLKSKCCYIKPIHVEDVIFFYEYDDSLFIQTREIKPAKSYIIAVRKGSENYFDEWCSVNENKLDQWPKEDTEDLFGESWTVYYTENDLNGQYYHDTTPIQQEPAATSIVMKGGIKNSNGCYFINALPYFEIPSVYYPNEIKAFMNLNGGKVNYKYKVIDNRVIVDVTDPHAGRSEISCIDICLVHNGKKNYYYRIKVCGQSDIYDLSHLYKFDQFGLIVNEDTEDSLYFGNHVNINYQSENVQGLFQIDIEDFNTISDDIYFVNLLAACCYDSKYVEISHANFRKCISYASTHLNIDIQKEGFISNVKKLFSKAGLLNIDYSTNRCQAIPPSFMRVPFSLHHTEGTQLLMLGGCYTRSFISDLIEYCDHHHVNMFYKRNSEISRDEEKLLPPIILLGHNFSPTGFCIEYGKQCDWLDNHDFALSLLNLIPSYKDICSKFEFVYNNSHQFISLLDMPQTNTVPRIRSLRSTNGLIVRYIEKANNEFAKIGKGLLPWASIICHHEMKTPMVIKQKDYSVYLPTTLILPNYVERALYLMNLGLPETKKVFICGARSNTYYTLMNKYKLHSENRCNVLALKISGSDAFPNNLVRDAIRTRHKMEFYKSKLNGSKYRELYMILKDSREDVILAIAYKHKVFLNCLDQFYRLNTKTVNEAMSFLIKGGWVFGPGKGSIGYSKNSGLTFDPVFDLTKEMIELPDLSQFNKEDIQII